MQVFDRMKEHRLVADQSGRMRWMFLGYPVCFHSWKRLHLLGSSESPQF